MRRYVHGDRHASTANYYCQACDLFVPPTHFDACVASKQTHTQRYDYWFKRLKTMPGVVDDRANLFR